MAKLKISDMVLPANWANYIAENTTASSAFYNSGIVGNVSDIAITAGGRSINIPFLGDITGDAELLSDTNPLTVEKISTGVQVGVVHAKGKAFSVNDLAKGYSGADPVGHIGNRIGDFWGRVLDTQLIAATKGVAGAASATHVLDISGLTGAAGIFSREAFIDAKQLLGDRRGVLKSICTHSAVVSHMDKLNDSELFLDAEDNLVRTYLGNRIVEQDAFAAESGVYTMVLFAENAFGFAEGMDLAETEMDRDILAGDTVLTSRRSYVLHPMGVSYTGTLPSDGTSPTNTQLATAGNWTVTTATKNLPIVLFKFRLA
jgi:hypothetical protein